MNANSAFEQEKFIQLEWTVVLNTRVDRSSVVVEKDYERALLD